MGEISGESERYIRWKMPLARGLQYQHAWYMKNGYTCTRDGEGAANPQRDFAIAAGEIDEDE